MSNKNYQDIINRIYEIYKELGISAGDSSNTPSEDSIKSTAEKILNNLISNPANSVGESIEVIKNKVLQIKSNTENVNNYLAPLKQKFDNIYNELNSTSSSYMKGKVNGIYSTVLDIYNILFSTGSGSIEQSLENLKGKGEFTYYTRADINLHFGDAIERDGYYCFMSGITRKTSVQLDYSNYYFDFRCDERTWIRYWGGGYYENGGDYFNSTESYLTEYYEDLARGFYIRPMTGYRELMQYGYYRRGGCFFYDYRIDTMIFRCISSIIYYESYYDYYRAFDMNNVKVYRKRK